MDNIGKRIWPRKNKEILKAIVKNILDPSV